MERSGEEECLRSPGLVSLYAGGNWSRCDERVYLRPVDRMPRGGGLESGSWFLAKAKHQADN